MVKYTIIIDRSTASFPCGWFLREKTMRTISLEKNEYCCPQLAQQQQLSTW
jgi:hypothetical protein